MKLPAILLMLLILLQFIPAGGTQSDYLGPALTKTAQVAIPAKEQCTKALEPFIVEDYEDGLVDIDCKGATASLEERSPILSARSLSIKLSGNKQAVLRIECEGGKTVKDYTGVFAWVKPSRDDIRMGVNLLTDKGTVTIRPQGLRHSGEALPAYYDFAGGGVMSQDVGRVLAISLIFYPSNGGEICVDNVGFADASYGSFNRAWWDETSAKRYVDQRFQETLNDYLSLYTLYKEDPAYKAAIIKGMDNIILSMQPDGWLESGTTSLITAGTLGATLANCYLTFKHDPAMSEVISVYGDNGHSRAWWVEKCLGQDVRFIDYVFSLDANKKVVRNQMMEGARATYTAYLATGDTKFLDSYRRQMSLIKDGMQGCGIYPEWTGSYDPSIVMYDSSYTAVQLSTLLSLAAMGEREYGLPMAKGLFEVAESVIDPSTGMLMNLNSTRRSDKEGDLRWQDALLYNIGINENVPGMTRLGYILYEKYPAKSFPADFHSALARYYDLKYHVSPSSDNGYRLPLERPVYSLALVSTDGSVKGLYPCRIEGEGYYVNPAIGRSATTFPEVRPFTGDIGGSGINAWFDGATVTLEGAGPVTLRYGCADMGLPASGTVAIIEMDGNGQAMHQRDVPYDNGELVYSTDIKEKISLVVSASGIHTATPSVIPTPTPAPPVFAICGIPFGIFGACVLLKKIKRRL